MKSEFSVSTYQAHFGAHVSRLAAETDWRVVYWHMYLLRLLACSAICCVRMYAILFLVFFTLLYFHFSLVSLTSLRIVTK